MFGEIDVVLPAGGRITGEFAQQAGTEIKALISFQGQTILRRTIETLRAMPNIGRIVVIGPEEALVEAHRCGADATLSEGATGPENYLRGLQWLQKSAKTTTANSRALIVTTDLPFLTTEALQRFLDACPQDADIAVPILTQKGYEARFPASPIEYVLLRDGAVTSGCVFLVNPQTLLRNQVHLERIFAARKSQWRMAMLVGGKVALKWVTKRLAVQDVVARASSILRCQGVPIFDAPAELAFDIDLLEEYHYACQHIVMEKELVR